MLDEDDYSETEHAENHPDDGNCYADPRDYGPCSCGLMSIYCEGDRDDDETGREFVTHEAAGCPVHGDELGPIYLADDEDETDDNRNEDETT